MILEFYQDNLELAHYEATQLVGKLVFLTADKVFAQVIPHSVYSDMPLTTLHSYAKRLAYTKRVYEEAVESDFAVSSYKVMFKPELPAEPKQYYDFVYAKCQNQNPHVEINLDNPQITFCLLISERNIVTRLVHEDDKEYLQRKAHLREKRHPSAISPKLARAMLNLAGPTSVEVLDPFCGTGGILIEGLYLGLHMKGSDIDRKMVYGSQINIENELATLREIGPAREPVYELAVVDAMSCTFTADAIVCDPPYGKNTKNIPEGFYEAFLQQAKKQTKQIILCLPEGVEVDFAKYGWMMHKEIPQYIHKSLTRMILHLKRA